MSKKILFLVVGLIVLAAGAFYLLTTNKEQAVNSNTQTVATGMPAVNDTQLSELPEGWQTYTSPEWGFSINHPVDMKIEPTQNGAHFLKIGDTQATGSEFFDGLSLLIFTAQLQNKSFEDFVQQEYQKIKNEPVYENVSALQPAQVANYSGYKFTATGLGTSTTYYLKNGTDGYVKISDMTVEPSNANRDFHKTVELMFNSLQVHTSNNANAGPSEEQAVSAVKSFAAQDLNGTVADVKIVSVQQQDWGNSCLGLAQEGEMCAEIITPGFEISVQVNGKSKIYRTNGDGSIIKIKS